MLRSGGATALRGMRGAAEICFARELLRVGGGRGSHFLAPPLRRARPWLVLSSVLVVPPGAGLR